MLEVTTTLKPPGLKNEANVRAKHLQYLEWPLEASSKGESIPIKPDVKNPQLYSKNIHV